MVKAISTASTKKPSELAILVHVNFSGAESSQDIQEFRELVTAAGAEPRLFFSVTLDKPFPKYFIGVGKAEELKQAVVSEGAQLIIFNHELSPAQERNLERLLKCRVLGRTGLILDIFAQRARTFEGKLQVELAQLNHLATRLIRGWTHLERQKGGIGLRGPGETQLETDRRLLRQRVRIIKQRLQKIRSQRQQNRQARKRNAWPLIALVGYTNAGKSTLFNQLCQSTTFVADQLFATLDPSLRQLQLPGFGATLLTDTVGFIKDLPHDLVDAFRATLEETQQADLLLHVVDASDPQRIEKIAEVKTVLEQINAEHIPQLIIYNKIDQLGLDKGRIDYNEHGTISRVWLSAAKGCGLEALRYALAERLGGRWQKARLLLLPQQSKLRHQLYELKAVIDEHTDDAGYCQLVVKLPEKILAYFSRLIEGKTSTT